MEESPIQVQSILRISESWRTVPLRMCLTEGGILHTVDISKMEEFLFRIRVTAGEFCHTRNTCEIEDSLVQKMYESWRV